DVLFFLAPLICCRTRRQLQTLVGRILLAIGIAGICFIAFPLRMAYAAPLERLSGIERFVFAMLAAKSTYNLAPSLHIALGSILCIAYVRRFSSSWFRYSVFAWFPIVPASTLSTYQHHVFDLFAGQA